MSETYKIDTQFQLNSRYRNLFRIKNGDFNYIETQESILVKEKETDSFIRVGPGNCNRLDLISHKYYGKAKLWWVIAIANGIIDPFTIEPGTILRVPNINTLYGYRGLLL